MHSSKKPCFRTVLLAGHRLLFFPEGTSTDGLRVLPFKSTLFAAFFDEKLRCEMYIQPVTVLYQAAPRPSGRVLRVVGGHVVSQPSAQDAAYPAAG